MSRLDIIGGEAPEQWQKPWCPVLHQVTLEYKGIRVNCLKCGTTTLVSVSTAKQLIGNLPSIGLAPLIKKEHFADTRRGGGGGGIRRVTSCGEPRRPGYDGAKHDWKNTNGVVE